MEKQLFNLNLEQFFGMT